MWGIFVLAGITANDSKEISITEIHFFIFRITVTENFQYSVFS